MGNLPHLMFALKTKYRITYRSNERKNAAVYSFTGDYLGRTFEKHVLLFSCRPDSGTLSFNTNWYDLIEVVPVLDSTPNQSPHKVVKKQ